ncbi:uncharacterized protein TRAVEDRAFT_53099 [Trametes versicolor FP-101664 SS1]|uniref:uncharacterized protein n=1 Tax=Trametes versicolor (strain FP-101664) TaxID=717944 RepID=UPI0004624783|nr:uncharacterized protein TRAVEDRAFT_53099 [Trametes versicolor FP-101664 SS1]EIW52658.1 hypothetical protein TRAVEDRAFT_53099 [Trametes versicolor FP-101664 SS1]
MTLHRRQTKFELDLLSRKAMWNADLPIHYLPAEILLHIFEQLVRALLPDKLPSKLSPPDFKPRRPWAPLMRVCRHWCALIRNGAVFWRDITISKNIKWFKLALSRLGNSPIRLQLAADCNLKAVLPTLDAHAGRIEKLILKGEVRDEDALRLESFLSRSFPVLRSLAIKMDSTDSELCAVGDNHPGLEWLELTRASLPWKKSLLIHLEVLSLTDCILSTATLPFPDFLDVLEQGQRLRYLHLTEFLSAALDPQTSAPHERLVTLPGLQHLECSDVPSNIARLMTHLRTPAISHVELVGDCNGNVPSTAHASLLPEYPGTPLPVLQTITRAIIDVTATQNGLRFSGPLRTSLELCLLNPDRQYWDEPPWVEQGLQQLTGFLGPALTELEVCGILDVSQETWDRVFDAFPSLEKLVVREHESGLLPTTMLRSLSAAPARSISTSAGKGRSARVRCPALTYLRIDGWDWGRRGLGRILDCLRVRAAHGASRLEYFGLDGEGERWVPEIFPILEKYRPRFLAVVDDFELDGWW